MKKKRTQNTQQHTVPTPKWLQRRMLHKLEESAKNRVSPSRTKAAKAVLQKLGEEDKPAHTNTSPVTKPTVASTGDSTFHQN